MKQRIVLLGPPASGKGTQAEMIREKFKIETPSVGAILREQHAAGTPLGVKAAAYTNAGRLAPDELIVEVVRTWLEPRNGSFVFDGFPRTLRQADALEGLLERRRTPLQIALSLDVDFLTISDRVSRRMVCSGCNSIMSIGRHVESADSPCPRCEKGLQRRVDDTTEALEQRMIEYREKSEPLVSFYEKRGMLKRIAAHAAPEEVFGEIAEALQN